jgi:cation/acetate symporter
MVVGTASTLLLIWLSPTVQIDVLRHDTAWFGLRNPALITIPLSFAIGIVVSLLTTDEAAAEGYKAVERQMHMGHSP